jgi:anti-sigma factor RsiW
MVCDGWKEKLDTYLDGELPESEMRAFDVHSRNCPTCAADALSRVQMKRAIQSAGQRFTPSAEFRKRIHQNLLPKRSGRLRVGWVSAVAAAVALVFGVLTSTYLENRSVRDQVFSEITDLHVATLASASPVDVISTDRHTVKPWFQGKIPFAFNLPDLQNTDFSLLGGRMTYLEQAPGAHLIYDARKHHISVFVFQDRSLPGLGDSFSSPTKQPLSVETWTQGGLRYFVVGDASATDIDNLAKLFQAASQ